MPIEPDQPGGSNDPTRANDPIDPTRAQDPVDPTRAQDPVDPTRAQDPVDPTLAQPVAGARYEDTARTAAPLTREPLRREPDGDDRKGAWWLWALLAAVLIAIVLFALLSQGDDDDAVGTADQTETEAGAVETVPEDTAVEDTTVEDTAPVAPAETTPDTTATTEAADGGAAAPGGDTGDAGTVTAEDGTDLFTVIQGDAGDAERLAPYADQDVQGQGVEVLDVVEGEGFWIGTSDQQRIFAHAPADTAAEVQVGQRITFDGFLEANPPADSADVHDIPEDQGAELHRQQGHHVELRSLTPA